MVLTVILIPRAEVDMRKGNVDFTEGRLLSSIIYYTVPLIFASLVQLLFNAADLAVLGNFDTSLDSSAVGAVGATGSIVALLVSSIVGLSGGTNVILSRAVGAKNEDRVQEIIGTSLILSLVLGIIMLAVGFFSARWFLDATACPVNCYDGALIYLYIYFSATPAILVYNFGAAIIRVSGDSRSPFIYILISGVLNVVLNFILCLVLTEKVAAVAVATWASNVLGMVLVIRHLLKLKDGPCSVDIHNLRFSCKELGNIFVIGLPTAFTSAIYSISNLQVQGAINAFGSSVVAGNSAAAQIESILNSVASSFATAAMVFVGHNVGAGKPERVKGSIVRCAVINIGMALVLGYTLLALGRYPVSLFVPGDEVAIAVARLRLSCLLTIFFTCALDCVLSFSMRAFGYSLLPMINSMITVVGFRVFWMSLVYPSLPTVGDPAKDIFNVYLCYMISWTLSMIVQIVMFSVVYRRYRRGKGKSV